MLLMLGCALWSATAVQSFAAKVYMVNYMEEPIIFQDCASDHEGTIQGMPEKGSTLKPGETSTFVINASHVLEGLTGQCWWETADHFDCFKNGTGPNGTTPVPPGKVTSCPYISWVRGIDIKAKSFGASWDFATPYEGVDTHWQEPGITHKRYCACTNGTSKDSCDQLCTNGAPTPSPPPSPQPASHYTNPKTGCAYDEKPMSVDRSGAMICAPKCVKSGGIIPHEKCPTDVPSGSTAEPSCEYIDYDTDIKYCSLDCRVDPKYKLQCPEGATCFEYTIPPMPPIQNKSITQGYCGYNQTTVI